MDYEGLIKALSAKRPVFDLEGDLQRAMVKTLKEEFPDSEVATEYPITHEGQLSKIDIRVVTKNAEHLIELKYKPTYLTVEVNGQDFETKHQGAQDLYCYDYLHDVMKLETLTKTRPDSTGCAIFLTNDERYWLGPEDEDADYYPFRLTDKREVSGLLVWQGNVERKGPSRQGPIELSRKYRVDWKIYSDLKAQGAIPHVHALFKYLYVEVE